MPRRERQGRKLPADQGGLGHSIHPHPSWSCPFSLLCSSYGQGLLRFMALLRRFLGRDVFCPLNYQHLSLLSPELSSMA